ncbi:hypothetical protein [Microbacterium thalli]|uniref:hypothetical protein n=1 Tax=Microbacterium thalli TaxID=3027921 RepID=UPI0023654722|nr:hypothetical protein [Microbacterium thalli]MDD7930677.1 hypothetical protein [Microbacterium thalli]
MLDLVDQHHDLHISAGSMPDEYLAAFDLPLNARIYRSSTGFAAAFFWASVRGRSALLLPPGPYPLTSTRAAVRGAASIAGTLLARAGGGPSITVGKSVRGTHRAAVQIERVLFRLSNIYVARDRRSASTLSLPVAAEPDLSLLSPPAPPQESRFVAISLRYDRPVAEQFLDAVVRWARESNLTPVFVTQVRRDERRHAELAALHGAEHVAWGDRTHRQQMGAVEQAYAHSAVVVTDRLHAALLGALGGAIPVAMTAPGKPSKIADAADGVMRIVSIEGTADQAEVMGQLDAARAQGPMTAAMAEAADRLSSVRARVSRALARG